MNKSRKTTVGAQTSIEDGILYSGDFEWCHLDTELFTETISDGHTKTIRLVSLSSNWHERIYLEGVGYQKEMIDTELTLRREIRSGKGHWYAYRRVLGKLHKRYVGTDEKVTQERLLEICQHMPTRRIGLIPKGK